MKATVSIIIPIYNAEKTLEKTLESIANQTYTNLQVILVDDGSTDGSGSICRKYLCVDDRFFLIQQQNSGVSAARNTGIQAADGSYLVFADSDDILPADSVENLVKEYRKFEGYLICGSYRLDKTRGRYQNYVYDDMVLSSDDYGGRLTATMEKISFAPWGKLFVTGIIKQHNICFPCGIPYGEDGIFLLNYLKFAQGIKTLRQIVYYYNYKNPSSAARKYYEDFHHYLKALCEAQCELYEKFDIEVRADIERTYFDRCVAHYIIHERDQVKVSHHLTQVALDFPSVLDCEEYARCCRLNDWAPVIKAWKNENRKHYCAERFKLFFRI